jgi:hypothetical protein
LFHADRNNESQSDATRLTEHQFYTKQASEIIRANGRERVDGVRKRVLEKEIHEWKIIAPCWRISVIRGSEAPIMQELWRHVHVNAVCVEAQLNGWLWRLILLCILETSVCLVQFPGQGGEECRLVSCAHPTSYAENTVYPRGYAARMWSWTLWTGSEWEELYLYYFISTWRTQGQL